MSRGHTSEEVGLAAEELPSAPLAIAGPRATALATSAAPIEPARIPRIVVRFTKLAFRALADRLGSAVLGGTPRAAGCQHAHAQEAFKGSRRSNGHGGSTSLLTPFPFHMC